MAGKKSDPQELAELVKAMMDMTGMSFPIATSFATKFPEQAAKHLDKAKKANPEKAKKLAKAKAPAKPKPVKIAKPKKAAVAKAAPKKVAKVAKVAAEKSKVSPLKAALADVETAKPWTFTNVTGTPTVTGSTSGGFHIKFGTTSATGTASTATEYFAVPTSATTLTFVDPPPALATMQPTPCDYCHDTTRVVWDPFKLGPPPPPADWESSHAWVWDFTNVLSIACPQCTPRGWGYASNGPWGEAHRIANKLAPYTDKGGFREAQVYVITWYYGNTSKSYQAAEAQLVAAKRAFYINQLMQEHFRGQNTPDWPAWTNPDACPVCNSFNFSPTRHPRTHEQGVGCCECATSWVMGPAKEPTEKEQQDLEYRLRLLGFSASTIKDLCSQFHFCELYNFGVPMGLGDVERLPDLR